ncbi:hypothetical protein QBC47DRAFT_34411 [Echria macrotheca]|uniref:Uncharacterized protein n=1 Tax=Echria macrotheca TaxID=438768 RepID=A0AAJ0F405_9PEZI|nr:hypothetical protein QBC47DRAFT_34411 [Echria macrotheca]
MSMETLKFSIRITKRSLSGEDQPARYKSIQHRRRSRCETGRPGARGDSTGDFAAISACMCSKQGIRGPGVKSWCWLASPCLDQAPITSQCCLQPKIHPLPLIFSRFLVSIVLHIRTMEFSNHTYQQQSYVSPRRRITEQAAESFESVADPRLTEVELTLQTSPTLSRRPPREALTILSPTDSSEDNEPPMASATTVSSTAEKNSTTVFRVHPPSIYAICFPHMDAKRYMLPAEDEGPIQGDYTKSPATSLAYTTLKQMSTCLRMAETYVEYFRDMVKYYEYVKQDYERFTGKKSSSNPAEEGKLSVRMGGGGLEEWKKGFKVVKHGEILPVDDDRSSSRDSTMEPGSSVGPDNSYHAEQTKTPRSKFTLINNNHNQDYMDAKIDSPSGDQDPVWLQSSCNMQRFSSQSSYAVPSPQVAQSVSALAGEPDIPNIPTYGSWQEMGEYLMTAQSLPWNLVPGSID